MSRLLHLLRRLRGETRGAATIEFALWGSIFFMAMLTALDFGAWRIYQLRLGSAVEQGAILAFKDRATLDQTGATAIGSYVGAAARLPAPGVVTVTTGCNGGTANCVAAASRACACLSTAGNANSFAPATCGSTCPGGTTAGYYLTVKASYPYRAVLLPRTLLDGRTLSEGVTVRLQ